MLSQCNEINIKIYLFTALFICFLFVVIHNEVLFISNHDNSK